MEHEDLQYKITMDDGPDSEILGRAHDPDLAAALYMAAVTKFPLRNVQLRHGAHIVKRHNGEPTPVPPVPLDPNLRTWSVHLIGKKLQHYGFVQAANEAAAIEAACEKFGLDQAKKKRLAVNLAP